MNNILLVEDDRFKSSGIIEFIKSVLGQVNITCASSLVEAVDSITENIYDLVLVDMAIPSHPIVPGEGAPISYLSGGLEVILELNSNGRHDPCVIITQYYEIEVSGQFISIDNAVDEINKHLDCRIYGCIQYTEGENNWKKELKEFLVNENSLAGR
jgi:CheY-like chemotaxis protein